MKKVLDKMPEVSYNKYIIKKREVDKNEKRKIIFKR